METPVHGSTGAVRRAGSSTFVFTTQRPVAILMVVLAVAVFGWVSYNRLALTLMPDISYPTLTVRTEYPGTAPEEMETLVSRPLEQELGIVPKLVKISSISQAGQSDVILEFDWDAKMASVAQDIREKVDRVRLPDGAERPLLLRYDPSLDPILRLGLHGPQTLFELRHLADNEIKRSLESIQGVAAVKVKGGLEEEFLVALDEQKLALLNLDINTVNNRLAQGNVNLPGGNLREGQTEYLVRTLNEFRTLDEIRELIIAQQNGVDVRLRDVALVRSTNKEREIVTTVNGTESIEIEIFKEAGANVVDVAGRVREAIFGTRQQQEWVARQQAGTLQPPAAKGPPNRIQQAMIAAAAARMTDFVTQRLPPGAKIDILTDQSVFIQQSIDEVKGNAIVGGLIAVVVLYVFLRNLLHTLIIGVTIPISIVATFAPMQMFGVSLNIISLGGLALGVGMLVDNAIVVLESIFRCREEGDDLVHAVVRGTGEVGGAVTASTLTTVAVFFPIVFVEGVAGQIFGDMALTVVFSLVASLVVALFFIPMLASRQFRETVLLPANGAAGGTGFLKFAALPDRPTTADRARALRAVMGGFLVRIGLLLLAVPAVVAMVIAGVTSVVLWPIHRPLQLLFARKSRPILEVVVRWFSPGAETSLLDRRVWPGIARTGAVTRLQGSVRRFAGRFSTARVGRRVVLALVALPLAVFLLAHFTFGLVMNALGSIFFLLGLAAALPIFTLARIAAIAIEPLIGPLLAVAGSGLEALQRIYRGVLDWSLTNTGTVVGGSFVLFAVVMFLGVPRLGRELIPQVHQGEFNVQVTLPVGTPLERTAQVIAEVERIAIAQAEVARTAMRVGTDEGATSTAEEGEHTGRVTVRMQEGMSAETETAVIDRIRAGVRDVPEIKMEITYPTLFTTKAPIEVEVRGYDLATLRDLSREAEAGLREIPGLTDVRSTLQTGNPELQVVYNRDRLAQFGLSLRTVAELVRNKVQGRVATDFRERERLIDVFVRLREEDRLGIEELRNLIVNPGGTVPIPLQAAADIRVAEGPSEIRRINQQRTALITANTRGLDLGTASILINDRMAQIEFPAGFHYRVAGQNEEMQTSINSMILALALAVFLVYIVMASQFESLVHPFIIMFSVPLALIGVVAALWIGHIPLSIIVFIGLIMLAGIVVNNAIVLIDFINTLRRAGAELDDAVRQAGAARLRPILMTTLTTVLGLLPMALGLGEGAEIRAPMAITVIVGLTSSTILTLVVIPTLYVAIERIRPRAVAVDETAIEPVS
ncbi:MAG TPA: efflux RND transporter permease subunit [Opitutaceae bacterium]